MPLEKRQMASVSNLPTMNDMVFAPPRSAASTMVEFTMRKWCRFGCLLPTMERILSG
jgi:hypothetical protein